MSDIKEYRKEHQENDYDKKLRTHKLKLYGIIGGIVVLVAVLATVLLIIKQKNSYSSYVTEYSVRRTDSGYAVYLCDESGYIRCSRDGAAAFSFKGTQKWNKTYEVNNISIAGQGNYFAVADTGNTGIYIFDKGGYISTVNTNLPIVKISISSQGLVAAILEDKEADYINMYDKDGSKLYSIKTTAQSDGIPTDISVSPDGKKLAAAFTSIKGTELATSVVFYNFGEVGQNENERIVGGFDAYGNQLVGDVEFLNGTSVVAVGENVISFYGIKEYPKLINNIEVNCKIEQIFYSNTNFGYVYTDEDDNLRKVCVYDSAGDKLFERKAEEQYTSFCFTEAGVMMYGDKEFLLINKKGREVIHSEFDGEISKIIPAGSNKDYLIVSLDKLYKIKFK